MAPALTSDQTNTKEQLTRCYGIAHLLLTGAEEANIGKKK
jgi:hypothetical protein